MGWPSTISCRTLWCPSKRRSWWRTTRLAMLSWALWCVSTWWGLTAYGWWGSCGKDRDHMGAYSSESLDLPMRSLMWFLDFSMFLYWWISILISLWLVIVGYWSYWRLILLISPSPYHQSIVGARWLLLLIDGQYPSHQSIVDSCWWLLIVFGYCWLLLVIDCLLIACWLLIDGQYPYYTLW